MSWVALASATGAQEIRREVANPERIGASTSKPNLPAKGDATRAPLPEPQTILDSEIVPELDLDDAPSYAPMEEVRGGPENAVLTIRPRGDPYVLSFTNGEYVPLGPRPGEAPVSAQRTLLWEATGVA